LLGLRPDLNVKWFDCRGAMVYPQSGVMTRYLVPGYLPCDVKQWGAELLAQVHWPDSAEAAYSLYELDSSQARTWIQKLSENPVYLGDEAFNAQAPLDGVTRSSPPNFEGLQLFGAIIDRTGDATDGLSDLSNFHAGTTVLLDTFWMLRQPLASPLKIFVHLTAPDGKIVAQWDGLDVNLDTLATGDMFGQRHRLELPADLLPGPYRISMGVYHPDSGARLQARLSDRTVDAVVLGMLTLVK
jgi:hypothetical protein